MMPTGESDHQFRVLSAIARIHRSMGTRLDLPEIAQVVVQELVSIIGCEACAILVLEAEKVSILAETGFAEIFHTDTLTPEMPAIAHIVQSRQSILTGNVSESAAAGCLPAGCAMKSLICTPIIIADEVKGIIHIDSARENAFTQMDLSLVEVLSGEIALAMERAALHAQVKQLSLTDPLTGCFNRRKLDEDLSREIKRSLRYNSNVSLLLLDIDWFKAYNDHHGHPSGDKLLVKLGTLLSTSVRSLDAIYRYGGEEFAILLPQIGKIRATLTARRLLELVRETPFDGEADSQPGKKLTVSIGVASAPADARSPEELIQVADAALYEAKRSGRNRVAPEGPIFR